MKFLMFIFISLFLLSCSPENKKSINPLGFIEKINPLWTTVLLDDFNNGIGIQGNTHAMNNGNVVLFNGVKNTFQTLNGLDVNTGKIIWTFDKDMVRNGNFVHDHFYSNGNYTIFKSLKDYYIFNISNGRYQKETSQISYVSVYGLQNNFYIPMEFSDSLNNTYYCVTKGDFLNLDGIQKISCPIYSIKASTPLGRYSFMRNTVPFEQSGNRLILMAYSVAKSNGSQGMASYWSLYNETKENWIFDSVRIEDSITGPHDAFYYNSKFYITDQTNLYCYSSLDAELLWQKEFPAQIDAMNIIEEHNKIVINCVNYTSYCINADSNTQIWQENTAASTSNIHYQDGVVYFIGGDTGKLHALDINTGKHYWKVVVPHLDGPGSSFSKHVGGMPAQNGKKGKIFTSSFTRAYCFEAVN